MQRIVFHNWILEADSAATRAAHAACGPIGPETCTCADCRNFVAARTLGLVYPPDVLDLFARLGLEPRETELAPCGVEADGRHVISGWLHAVGRILSGPCGRSPAGDKSWTVETRPISEGFELTFVDDNALAPPSLREHPLIQIEFLVRVPWVLTESDSASSAHARDPE